MPSLTERSTIRDYQKFVHDVYGLPNDRHFGTWDMLANVERFLMRGLKGIRKNNIEKTKMNLLISMSWFMSFLNQMHVDIEEEVWKRFPYLCSYCGSRPCACKSKRVEHRQTVAVNDTLRPKTVREFQKMFGEIYPSSGRTALHAGIHLAEEMGELSETILAYRGARDDVAFDNVLLEAADLFSCFIGVFNSLHVDFADVLAAQYANNCHECHKAPCVCSFTKIVSFKS